MPVVARSLIALGTLFLVHAAYSAHEHSQTISLGSSRGVAAVNGAGDSTRVYLPALKIPTSSFSLSSLPTDITLETLIALFLLTLGIVMSTEPLKPIRWNEWAAEVEHGKHGRESKYIEDEHEAAKLTTEQQGQRLYGGPGVEGYGWLNNGRRMGFFDIRTKRRDFAEGIKQGGEREISKTGL